MKLLSYSPLFDFIIAVWHVDRMQADRPEAAKFFKNLPREAITSNQRSEHFIHKWLLESLLTTHFTTKPSTWKANKRFRILQVNHWGVIAELMNLIHRIEEGESAVTLNETDIMVELHRIAQRQFPWQRGFAVKSMFHRSLRVYRTPETIKRFQEDKGIAFDDFVKLGVLYWAALKKSPFVKADLSFNAIGIDDATRNKFLSHISDTPQSASQHASQFLQSRIAYRPSRLRTHPIVDLENDLGRLFVAPLVDLVFLRVTQGLFFDFVKHNDLKEIIASRFVDYCIELFKKGQCNFDLLHELEYKKGKRSIKSPDFFLVQQGIVSAAIECKARRMSHQAQFGEDPTEQSKSGFDEIAKGMTQLWRYLADADQDFLPAQIKPNAQTRLVLLTYDTWMEASYGIQPEVTARANKLADGKNIPLEFRRPIIFVTVQDLEHLVARGDSDQILSALDGQLTEKYKEWSVPGVFDDLYGKIEPKDLFTNENFREVVPWFS